MGTSGEGGPAWRLCERGAGCVAPAARSSQAAASTASGCHWELEEPHATRARQRQQLQPGRRLLRTAAAAAAGCSTAAPAPPVRASAQLRFASLAAAHAPSGSKQFSADGLQAVPAAVMEGELPVRDEDGRLCLRWAAWLVCGKASTAAGPLPPMHHEPNPMQARTRSSMPGMGGGCVRWNPRTGHRCGGWGWRASSC